MSIKAIETVYAGCLFRSRLEARWAVFFDKLGIRWEYEAQGFECTHRLTQKEGTFRYLPDFWLPDLGLYAEVKGVLTELECVRLLDAAASLSSDDGGGCGGGNDVLILGPIDAIRWPWRLHMHKGGLSAVAWNPEARGSGCPLGWHIEIAADYGGSFSDIAQASPWRAADIPELLIRGQIGYVGGQRGRALIAARSARFEHGQSGAVL